MQPCAVARLAIRIHRTAMPDGFQGINGRSDDTARRFAVGRRDKADAAGIRFKFGAVHAVTGDACAFGFAGHAAFLISAAFAFR